MRFLETTLRGAFVIEPEPSGDARGFFARTFCRREFENHGLNPDVCQTSVSYNRRRGTLRGMHYQMPPYAECKLVRCNRGSIYDVIIDLRRGSPTFGRWVGYELSAANRRMLYIPEGFAHGFETLDDESEVSYQMSEFYAPDSQRGVRWDDPAFAIRWPMGPVVISERDRSYPDFDESELSRLT